MEFFLNQVTDVGTRITWTDKKFRRFLFELKDLMDFKGEINNNWGMYSLYIHSNGRTMKDFIERLCQYGINIDSADRNILAFPNPFQFNIIFNGNKYSNGPVIQKKYKDIKYIKLETLTLPDNYTIKKEFIPLPNATYTTLKNYFDSNYKILNNNDIYPNPIVSGQPYYRLVSVSVKWSISFTINKLKYTFNESGYTLNENDKLTKDDYNTIYLYLKKNYYNVTLGNLNISSFTINITEINIYWIINYIINDDPSIVYEIDKDGLYNKYYIDTSKKMSDDRMFYVYIPEIKSNNYTTAQQNVTFFVQPTGTNSQINNNNILLNNIYPTFLFYKDSLLENATKYTVKIYNKFGQIYKTDNLDYNANIAACDCQTHIDYSCKCTYIRNPYYVNLQVSLQFKFGTFEDDLYKELLNPHPRQG